MTNYRRAVVAGDGIAGTAARGFHAIDTYFQILRCLLVVYATLSLTKPRARRFNNIERTTKLRVRDAARGSIRRRLTPT